MGLVDELLWWARGHLPAHARRRKDTADFVQDAVVEALGAIDDPGNRPRAVLRRYLQKAILNRIRDEIRRADKVEVTEHDGRLRSHRSTEPSPLECAIESENVRRFRRALNTLPGEERMLIVGRIDERLSYTALAIATGRPSADAARVATFRAVRKLSRRIGEDSNGRPGNGRKSCAVENEAGGESDN